MTRADKPSAFGPYELVRRLAVGGMAEVYLARLRGEAGFEKPVAVKRIHPRLEGGEAGPDALVQEAKLSASLCHPNIVQTLDLSYAEGSYALVMEHVEGYDLHHVIGMLREAGRPFPIDLASHVAAEVCRALDYAHHLVDEQGEPVGLVHRDVSPENILLSFAGEVKLADFGIAKTTVRPSDPGTRMVRGKYFYMSPEQAQAGPVDHRSDIFSAGVVLWELLAGRRLHQAHDVASLLRDVRRAEVPLPSSLRAGVPRELDEIVARATARRRDERYPRAGAMADALTAYLRRRPAVHATRQLGEVLAGLRCRAAATPRPDEADVPRTRDHVVTQPAPEGAMPPKPTSGLEDTEQTLTGWRRPETSARRHRWMLVLAVGSLMVGILLWSLHGV